MTGWTRRTLLAVAPLLLAGCDDDPLTAINVPVGQTAIIVLVNPPLNWLNQASMAEPGALRRQSVGLSGGPSTESDVSGLAVLQPVAAGDRTMTVGGTAAASQILVPLQDKELKEIAVASTGFAASPMMTVGYRFGGTVVEVSPSTPVTQINAELAKPDQIVSFLPGNYTGDFVIAGRGTTLFGQGATGQTTVVTITGNVAVNVARARMRGVRVTGNVTVPADSFWMSFGRVDGTLNVTGNGVALLKNALCGTVTATGNDRAVVGNAGPAPIRASEGGC